MAEEKNSQTEIKGNFADQSSGSGASVQPAKDNASSTETGTRGNVTNKVKGLYQTAADSEVGQAAKDALGKVKDNAATAIDDKKANLAQGLTSVSDTIRQFGDSVKSPDGEPANKVAELTTQYTESLSQQVEKLSGYLERQDIRGLLKDLESFARRNPAIFLGGAFALGIVAARFLKSSNPNQALMRTSDASDFDSGFNTTPSNSGNASTGTSVGDKPDSFGKTSGSSGSEADNVRPFNTGSGVSSGTGATGATGTTGLSSSTGPGSSGSSKTTPTPSNKTGGDFGSSKS